jgi:ABC-type bacteriocin/lantibiotic exporter with double-glycine peptidase domain
VTKVPFVSQVSDVDCGAACLAMSLRCLGNTLPLETIAKAIGVGRDGIDASGIVQGAQLLGYRARAVRVDFDKLRFLRAGAILHWEMEHFVVFERVVRNGIIIVDPATGRRRVELRELGRALTGIAVIIEPSGELAQTGVSDRIAQNYWKRALLQSKELRGIIISSIALQLIVGAFPLVSSAVIDRVVPRHDFDTLWLLGIGVAGMVVFFALFTIVRGMMLANLQTRLDLDGAATLVEHMVSLPMQYFALRSPGDLMVRVRSNETLRNALSGAVLASVLDGLIVILYIVVLIVIDLRVMLVASLCILLLVGVYLLVRGRRKELVAELQNRQGLADGQLIDIITGIETLKVSAVEESAVSQWVSRYVDVLNINVRKARLMIWSDAAASTVRTAGPFVVLLVGVTSVLHGTNTLGNMLAALALAQGIIQSVSTLLQSLGELDALTAVVARLNDVLGTQSEHVGGRTLAPPLSGEISLSGVTFAPHRRAEPIVKNVSLTIPAGSFVAFVGSTGSGKSTLASLVAGLIVPTEGEISFNGVAASSLDIKSLRRQMGVVVQRAQMFGQNIRDNITMLQDIPMDEVEHAASLACIHDDIEAMGMKYLTPLMAGGSISGGQRQRISLARALVRNPKVLILDEATSALDAVTEHNIFENIRKMGCTRVVIAHRLSTIRDADRIFVLDNGELVETGTHDELRLRQGAYAKLLMTQVTEDDASAAAPS